MTTKRPRPKTETKPTAGARKARQTAAPDKPEHPPPADLPTTCPECGGPVEPWITDALRAVRCLSCPQFIIIENNAPVRRFNGLLDEETMRHQHARHAAAQRDAWEAEADALRTALNAGAADTMLARAKLAIEGYPSGLWRMGWTRPECRDLAAVQSAKRNLDGLLALAALTCCEIARKAGSDPAPFGIGAATLRKVYEDGLLPAADGDWPACMEPGEIDRLPETTGADLRALRDALARLKYGGDGKADERQAREDLHALAEATRAKMPPKRKPGPGRKPYYDAQKLKRVEDAITGHGGSLQSAAVTLKMTHRQVKAIHDAARQRRGRKA